MGDVAISLLVGHYVEKLAAGGKVPAMVDAGFPFTHVQGRLREADLLVGNLESVVSRKGSKDTDHNPFRAPLGTPQLLLRAGFDVVSVANNHARDFGRVALQDMLRNLRGAGLPAIGAETFSLGPQPALVRSVRGLRVGLLSYYTVTANLRRAVADVTRARDQVEVLVIYNHWGLEGEQRPLPAQRRWAHALIDAGADLVVGSHVHVLQPEERYRGKLVFYGLGNFVFTGMSYDALHRTGGYLEVDVDRRGVLGRRFWRVRLDRIGVPRWIDEAPVEPCTVIPCAR